MKDAEILTLVDRLERCLLAAAEFHHRDHLTVAVVYLYSSDFATALDRMGSSLLRFVAHHGGSRYHETLTRFWMVQVERNLDRNVCLEESVRRVTEALPDKNLAGKYYSAELLGSAKAKEAWVEPDRARL